MNTLKIENHQDGKSTKIKIKYILEMIRSRYILSKIFNLLEKTKTIKIIKHNKKAQNKLNISKEFFKEISEIEIEIIPSPNEYGKFIKIYDIKLEKYYHAYFNDSKEEIKRYYLTEKDNVNKIRMIIDYQIESFYGLFFGCNCIESVDFIKFNRNNIIDMNNMFAYCRSLKKVKFTNFNSKNVKDMSYFFEGCSSLKEIYLIILILKMQIV